MVALLVTFTKPPTLGAVMLNSLQGKVIAPTVSICEFDSRIASGTVSRLDVPWMLNTPLAETCTTWLVRALPEASVRLRA